MIQIKKIRPMLSRFLSSACVLLCFAMLNGCVSSKVNGEQDEKLINYFSNLRAQVDILWHKEVLGEVNELRAKGAIPARLSSPDNEVHVLVNVAENGSLQSFEILKKSKYKFINNSIRKSIKEASPFPPPPSECIKNKICKIRWEFVLKS